MPVVAKLMPNYVSASVVLSFAGFLNGYDTGCIGAIAHMKQFAATVGRLSATMLGITVSVIMLTGIVPTLFGGHLADRHGRLRVVLPGAALFGLGAAIQATSFGLAQFMTGRAISGAGQGVFLANVSVYITEIAPHGCRGRLAAMPQFMAALGICVGYFCCYGTASIESSLAWRLPYIVQVAVSTLLTLACRALPESPRWLLLHGRAQEAARALEVLDFNMDEARRDFLASPQEQPSLPSWQSFALLFRGGYRPRTLLALFVLSMAQLSGIDAITYYAPVLFTQAGISAEDSSSLVASGVASITMAIVSIPAFLLADRWGRRTSAITGGICLSSIILLVGSLYAAGAVHPTGLVRWGFVVSVFLFGMVFCATWGIVCKIYASEIQPGNTRAAGNSVGIAFSFVSLPMTSGCHRANLAELTNWLVALITPILLAASVYGAYFLFGLLALLGVAVFTFYMPETRGRSLESIQVEFGWPKLSHLSRLLRPFGIRRRVVASPHLTSEAIEMQPREQEPAVVSFVAAARGLRLDGGSV